MSAPLSAGALSPPSLAVSTSRLASKRARAETVGAGFLSLSAVGDDVESITRLVKKMSLPGDAETYSTMSAKARYAKFFTCSSEVDTNSPSLIFVLSLCLLFFVS